MNAPTPAKSMLPLPGPQARLLVPRIPDPQAPEQDFLTDSSSGDQSFYSKLLLYSMLEPYKGYHVERQHSQDAVHDTRSLSEMRRDFLDKISYLCDTEKGGATVTAAALQHLPLGNILWLTANEDVKADTKDFINRIVRKIVAVNESNAKTIENAIFSESVRWAYPRMLFYRRQMVKLAGQCREALKLLAPVAEDGEWTLFTCVPLIPVLKYL